jgi:hypothetical protein
MMFIRLTLAVPRKSDYLPEMDVGLLVAIENVDYAEESFGYWHSNKVEFIGCLLHTKDGKEYLIRESLEELSSLLSAAIHVDSPP